MPSAHAGPQQWIIPTVDPAAVARLAEHLHCPNAIASILLARGISDPAAAQTFLTPTIDDLIDPTLMLGINLAIAHIQRAVRSSKPILIYGDYDVDGTTATVLLKTAIERVSASIGSKDTPSIVTY